MGMGPHESYIESLKKLATEGRFSSVKNSVESQKDFIDSICGDLTFCISYVCDAENKDMLIDILTQAKTTAMFFDLHRESATKLLEHISDVYKNNV